MCRFSGFCSAGKIIPFEYRFTCICTKITEILGITFEIRIKDFSPRKLKSEKPAFVALLAALNKIRAASLLDLIRITSSVRVTVTEIAF